MEKAMGSTQPNLPDDSSDTNPTESPWPSVREVKITAPFLWLKDGFKDLLKAQFASVFYGVCFALMGWTIAFLNDTSFALTLAATSAFMLLGPVLSIGLYNLSDQLQKGKAPNLRESLTVWRGNIGNLALFALVSGIVALIWARASAVIFAVFYNTTLPSMGDFASAALSLENLEFIFVYFGVGLFFAVFMFAISVVAVPLMYDRRKDAVTAVLVSLQVVGKNPGAMLVWALILVTLISIGFLTGFLGLIYTAPIAGHATWHAYKQLVHV